MKKFKELSRENKVLIHKSFQDNFYDLTSAEQKTFNDYCFGLMPEQELKTIIKYLEKDLLKFDNLSKYKAMVAKLDKGQDQIMFSDINNSTEIRNLINTLKEQ